MAIKGSEQIVVKRKGGIKKLRDSRLSSAIRKAFEHHLKEKEAAPELREARGLIAGRAKDFLDGKRGSVSFEVGGLSLSVTPRYEAVIDEENVKEVRRLLGPRFRELVKVKKRYVGSSGLLDDAEVRKLVSLRELSPSFRWGI
jgi:hypothetical protein